jgi:hypothetical protein
VTGCIFGSRWRTADTWKIDAADGYVWKAISVNQAFDGVEYTNNTRVITPPRCRPPLPPQSTSVFGLIFI